MRYHFYTRSYTVYKVNVISAYTIYYVNVFIEYTVHSINNANNATHYVKLGKKRQESSKCNYYIIFPRVILKAIIFILCRHSYMETFQYSSYTIYYVNLNIEYTVQSILYRHIYIETSIYSSYTVHYVNLNIEHTVQSILYRHM